MRSVLAAASVAAILITGASKTLAQPVERVPAQSLVEDLEGSAGIGGTSAAPPLVRIAVDLIKDFEGWFPKPYDDPSGYCTIGFGHLISKKLCSQTDLSSFPNALTVKEGEELLESDTASARKAVRALVKVDLTDEQFGALASFTFNVGKNNFSGSTLLALLNDGEYDRAAQQFQRWTKSKGVELPGLVTRRACEVSLFLGDMNVDEPFTRKNCDGAAGVAATGAAIDIEVGEN